MTKFLLENALCLTFPVVVTPGEIQGRIIFYMPRTAVVFILKQVMVDVVNSKTHKHTKYVFKVQTGYVGFIYSFT